MILLTKKCGYWKTCLRNVFKGWPQRFKSFAVLTFFRKSNFRKKKCQHGTFFRLVFRLLPIVVEDETRQKQCWYFYNGVKMCPAQAKQRQMCDENMRLHGWNFLGKNSTISFIVEWSFIQTSTLIYKATNFVHLYQQLLTSISGQ